MAGRFLVLRRRAVAHGIVGVLAGVIFGLPLAAQSVGAVRGRVVDSSTSQGLPNASVIVEGAPIGAVTGTDGSFNIPRVPAGVHTLRARRIGYHSATMSVNVPAGGTVSADFMLFPEPSVLTEMVVTGYGEQRREAITGAVATVDATQADVGVITNPTQLIQGRAAGVEIVQSNGEPGGNTQIRIRGGTSISASNDPLYVIDGVPVQNDSPVPGAAGVQFNAALDRNPLNNISPDDIETITILKDASATAIYGSRGANGVILVTTKRGTREAQIEYETYVGAATPTRLLSLANGNQYRAFVTANQDSLGGATAVAALGNANTDWQNAITHTGLTMNHNLSFTGGSAQTKYRASLNYFDNEGAVINSDLKRYQGRLNATHDALDGRLRLALNLSASQVNNQFSPNENMGGFNGGLFTNMLIYNPTYPVTCAANVKPCTGASSGYYESGPTGVFNPVGMINQIQDQAPEKRVLGNITGTLALRDNLTAQTTLGSDNTDADRRTYLPIASPVGNPFGGYARAVNRTLQNLTFQQLLTFSPKFSGSQEFEVVGGYEMTQDDNREFGSASQGFISDAFATDNMVAGSSVPSGYPYSWRTQSSLESYFGRVNYGYAGKYFLTGVLRDDGSSRLAPGHKWATFPGLSGSWRLSEESFMKDRPMGISSLALRAGWGKQGNQSVAPYQTLLLLTSDPSSLYPFGGVITSGLAAAQVGNPNLKWETAAQTNVGLDFGLFHDKVTGGMEVYQKDTRDLLLTVPVPQPAVVSTQLENIGGVRNRGFEAYADMKMWEAPRKSLTGGLNLTIARNTVTSLGDSTAACQGSAVTQSFKAYSSAGCLYYWSGTVSGQGQSNQNSEIIMRGQAIGTFLVPKFIGVKNGVQYFACSSIDPNCVNGATSSPVDADRQFVGTADPSFTIGLHNNLTWNDFDASWLWRGEFGGNTFNNTALVYESKSDAAQGRNFLAGALTMPDNVHEPAKLSSRWIEDRTFVRLQNITLGWTVPKSLMKGRATRLFVSGDNLALFTKYSGYDPEVFTSAGLASRGVDYLSYPQTRRYTVGLRTQF